MAAELKTSHCIACGIEDEDVLDHLIVNVEGLEVDVAVCANDQRRYHARVEGHVQGLEDAVSDVAEYMARYCR